jgi:GMP synthase-like glutamine amidotransferase
MQIGILEAGGPPPKLADQFDTYANMTRRLLGPAFRAQTFRVFDGEFPAADSDCQAWLITGSASGAYDDAPWIAALQTFIQTLSGTAPLVGICFGHQLMAQAFGGEVIKSPKGRGLGLHRYDVLHQASWMDSSDPIHLPVAHQDQVFAIGAGCEVLAGSEFTPFGMLAYPARRAISIQAHPEFEPAYASALVEINRTEIGDAAANAAITSLAEPNSCQRAAVWLRRFLGSA